MHPSLSTDLQYLASKRLAHCISVAEQYFQQTFPIPSLSFKLKGKTAGKAYLQPWEIRLNPILFSENQDAFIEEVIPHEVAHLLAFKLYGRVPPHGKHWQAIMHNVFKVIPKTTHQMDISSVQGKVFEYHCQCSTYPLTIRRHNKVQRQQASYRCIKCHEALRYSGQQG
ncbi:SprT family protein [Vibrio sp. 10N.286.49.C2]|uniref:SprT family zinc-dependent metalloprotease n=1 Tax=unclassified Vibrio TaxID=2614977 RepID=UPI000C860CA7|nr:MULTISPECIES: SprT family zinc-dependent metalloprotease [unclassified Vibrio]PMH29430.1 SprT family protein [Vibrio sp. 10N.286.49.C2]PMH55945.1 SprT family protein [Vibrio sp. 10N.286.49.B1]PMH81025.1 SprT family protein [Vibrio sp. 10N.286.48.B7]